MAQLLTLGGVTIKKPNDFQIEFYYLSKAGRTADGTMQIDKIADKRKFLFKYESIKGSNLIAIRNILEGSNAFFTLTYTDTDISKSAVVYVGAIKKAQFRTDTGAWYWKDVSFDLIEQ